MTPIPMVSDELAETLPWVTVQQMVEVDPPMVEDYEIHLLQMMEHAGRHLAYLARERFFPDGAGDHHVVVLAGPSGNDGGAPARRLRAWRRGVRAIPLPLVPRFAGGLPHGRGSATRPHRLAPITVSVSLAHAGAPPPGLVAQAERLHRRRLLAGHALQRLARDRRARTLRSRGLPARAPVNGVRRYAALRWLAACSRRPMTSSSVVTPRSCAYQRRTSR